MAEVTVTVNYLLSHLYNKLPRRRVDLFGEVLDRLLRTIFHDFLQTCSVTPTSGSSTISIPPLPTNEEESENEIIEMKSTDYQFSVETNLRPKFQLYINGEQSHPIFFQAASESTINIGELLSYLPHDILFTLQPGSVYYQVEVSLDPQAPHNCVYKPCEVNRSSEKPTHSNPTICSLGSACIEVMDGASGVRPSSTRTNVCDKCCLHSRMGPSGISTSPSGHHLYPPPRCHRSSSPHYSSHPSHEPLPTNEQLCQQMAHFSMRECQSASPETCQPVHPHTAQGNSIWSSLSPSPTNANSSAHFLFPPSSGAHHAMTPAGHSNAASISSKSPSIHLQIINPTSSVACQCFQPPPGMTGGSTMSGNSNLLDSHYLQKSNSTPNFTAATFAQTKFGSTKLRIQQYKPKRAHVPNSMTLSGFNPYSPHALAQNNMMLSEHSQLSRGTSFGNDGGGIGMEGRGPSSSALFLGPPSVGSSWGMSNSAAASSLRPPRSSSTQHQLNRLLQPHYNQLPSHQLNSGLSSGFGTAGCSSTIGSNLMANRSLSLSPYAPLSSSEMYEDAFSSELYNQFHPVGCGNRNDPQMELTTVEEMQHTQDSPYSQSQEENEEEVTGKDEFSQSHNIRPHHYSFPSHRHPPPQWTQRRTSGPGGLSKTNPTFNIYGPDDESHTMMKLDSAKEEIHMKRSGIPPPSSHLRQFQHLPMHSTSEQQDDSCYQLQEDQASARREYLLSVRRLSSGGVSDYHSDTSSVTAFSVAPNYNLPYSLVSPPSPPLLATVSSFTDPLNNMQHFSHNASK